IPESNHLIPMICDFRASGVICLARRRVLRAIDLDGQPRSRTSKIYDIFANGVLSAKPLRSFQLAKCSPQPLLRFGHISRQTTRDYCSLPDHRCCRNRCPHLTRPSPPPGAERENSKALRAHSPQLPALAMMVENSFVASAADMPGVLQ